MHMTLKFDQRSLQEVLRKIKKAGGKYQKVGEQALRMEAETIMTAAKEQTPVEWGSLKGSGLVEQPKRNGDWLRVRLLFGGPAGSGDNDEDVGYAVYVHEDLEAHHEHGNAKFLERPIKAAYSGMVSRLAAIIKRAV